MKKIFGILSIIFLSGFWACNHSNERKGEHMNHEQVDVHPQPDSESLSLDQDKKWLVDEPTRMHVENMEEAVLNFPSALKDMKSYNVLATSMKEDIQKLTADCKMQGQAHDELHKWLIPHIAMIKQFADAVNVQEADAMIQKIKKSFEEFHQFFE